MNPEYPIIQIKKLKKENLNIVDSHNLRNIAVHNADGTHRYHRFLGASNLSLRAKINEKIAEYHINRVQKNTVVALELVLSASRKYFLKEGAQTHDEFCNLKLKKWVEITIDYLKAEFNQLLISIDIHLDEATPHIHAIVFPAHEKLVKPVGRKSKQVKADYAVETMRYCLDSGSTLNKKKLAYYLDRYAEFTKPLGLIRPIPKKKAANKKLKIYYEEIFQKESIAKELEQARLELAVATSESLQINTEVTDLNAKRIRIVSEMRAMQNSIAQERSSLVAQRNLYIKMAKEKLESDKAEINAYSHEVDHSFSPKLITCSRPC